MKIAVTMEIVFHYKRHVEIFAGIQDYAKEHDYCDLHLVENPELLIAEASHYDGIVGRLDKTCLAAAKKAKIPAVNVLVGSAPPAVSADGYAWASIATEHLIARGLRRITFIGDPKSAIYKSSAKGICDVAKQNSCSFDKHSMPNNLVADLSTAMQFRNKLYKMQIQWKSPIGVICENDQLCRQVATNCESMGWKIPQELSLIGFGNDELSCNIMEPTLSSIDPAFHEVGYEAVKLLDALIQGEKPPSKAILIPPKALIVRQSSDAFAVSDEKVEKTLHYIANNSSQQLSLAQISQVVGLGPRALQKRFTHHVGRSVINELIRMRVETMKRLLVQSEDPILEISDKVGFGNTASMHLMFKRYTGITPTQYREEHSARKM